MRGESSSFKIRPMSGGCGAEISGVDLSTPLEKEEKLLSKKLG